MVRWILMSVLLLADTATNAEAIGVWVAIGVGLISSVIGMAVLWGGMRSAHKEHVVADERFHVDVKDRMTQDRDEELRYRAERKEEMHKIHRWQESQDERLLRTELSNARILGRLHRVEEGDHITPPPRESDT